MSEAASGVTTAARAGQAALPSGHEHVTAQRAWLGSIVRAKKRPPYMRLPTTLQEYYEEKRRRVPLGPTHQFPDMCCWPRCVYSKPCAFRTATTSAMKWASTLKTCSAPAAALMPPALAVPPAAGASPKYCATLTHSSRTCVASSVTAAMHSRLSASARASLAASTSRSRAAGSRALRGDGRRAIRQGHPACAGAARSPRGRSGRARHRARQSPSFRRL